MSILPPADTAVIAEDTAAAERIAGPEQPETSEFVRIGRRRLLARRFLHSPSAIIGAVIFILLLAFSILGGLLTPYAYDQPDFLALTQPPGGQHLLGTTAGGNDLLAEVVHALRRSLVIAVSVSVITIVLSAVIGAGAAYIGGRAEQVALAVIHFLLVVPSFLILALVSFRVGGDWRVLIVVLAVFGWMGTARVIWSVSTSLRERDFVRMAEIIGVSPGRIIVRHIIPNLGSLLIVNVTLGVVSTVLTETSLSFLGFGIKPPDVSLGVMLQDGSAALTTAPWIFLVPAAVLVLLTVSVTLIGDGLRDALDPNAARGGTR